MTGTKALIERIEIDLRDRKNTTTVTVPIDVVDNTLSRKWLAALVDVVRRDLHLEKNYCFLGFPDSPRNGDFLCQAINASICAVNAANLGYHIDHEFNMETALLTGPIGPDLPGLCIDHDQFNRLHRYFEDLQGVSGATSIYYQQADAATRWHIRQLNLLCHEFETWALSYRKAQHAPDWVRPSQLMCWLLAPRFRLTNDDYDLFGIDSLHRDFGGVYVGVNKAIGKHHWEVFQDEGRDSRIDELTTSSLRSQTEAAADFDIEWARDTRGYPWMSQQLAEFRTWLVANGFDPDDPALTIGHPKVAQVDLAAAFGTEDVAVIWKQLSLHLDVQRVSVAGVTAIYDYHWSDDNYMHRQIHCLGGH
jgi:hypothetical protein